MEGEPRWFRQISAILDVLGAVVVTRFKTVHDSDGPHPEVCRQIAVVRDQGAWICEANGTAIHWLPPERINLDALSMMGGLQFRELGYGDMSGRLCGLATRGGFFPVTPRFLMGTRVGIIQATIDVQRGSGRRNWHLLKKTKQKAWTSGAHPR